MRHPLALVPAALALVLLAGCSSGTGEGPAGAGAGDAADAGTDVSAGLASVAGDVETVAVRLEGYYRGAGYPEDLAGAEASLEPAGLTLSEGNRLGTYAYDPDAVEFALCVENDEGAFATYDTAPMTVRQSGEDGGCPAA